jgi:hypothetical protein
MQNIPRRLSRCIVGEEPFHQGSEYVSIIDSKGIRKDFCLQCWEKMDKSSERNFWKGKIPSKKEKCSDYDQKALELFRMVKDPKYLFVLGLYLERKGQIVPRTKTLYEAPETGELFSVEKINLTMEEAEKLAKEIEHMLTAPVAS